MGHVAEAMEKNTEIAGEEYLVTCKDGSKKTCFIFGVIAAGKIFVMFDDITERVRMVKALQDSKGALRRILEQAPVCIAVYTLDGKLNFLNAKFTQTFGYKSAEMPTAEDWMQLAYPDAAYREKLGRQWNALLDKAVRTNGEIDGGEYRIVAKDGTTRTVMVHGVVTDDKQVVCLLEDITRAARTERALAGPESLSRALIETTGTGYVGLDGHGRVQDANREYVRLSGHSDLKEIMGRSVLEWSAQHHQARAWEAVEIVMRDGRLINFELDYVDKAGKFTTIEINATVVTRGGVQQILGLCRDVSARSKTEAELRDSESLYRALVETTRTGYVVIDTQGRVTDANKEYVRLTGRADLKEILGHSVIEWTSPEQQAGNADAVARCARDGYVFNFETEYTDPKGRRTPVEINATVVNRRGTPHIHTLCRDITDRRRAEAELQSLNHGLEKRVEERTADLSAANMELTMEIAQRIDAERGRSKLQEELLQSQKMELVGRLAGGIAHDFNNILVAISGYAEMLLKKVPPAGAELEDLNEIIRETERGALLTRQLTTISRRQPLELKELNVNSVVEDSCKMLRRLIGANIRLTSALARDLGAVKADQGQVAQVIMNLVINARDAMPDGGSITLATANEELAARPEGLPLAPQPGSYVTLTVTDTGAGIEPGTETRIFEPFFTTKPEGKGTGLGLSTVFSILQQAQGGIGLKSEPGKGSSFKIYFPRLPVKA